MRIPFRTSNGGKIGQWEMWLKWEKGQRAKLASIGYIYRVSAYAEKRGHWDKWAQSGKLAIEMAMGPIC